MRPRGRFRSSTGEYREKLRDSLSAQEVAAWVYCPESWRLEYGLGLEPGNRAERAAGVRHHARKAVAERIAGGVLWLGGALIVVAGLGLLLQWLWR
jgi:hypothetical protein